MSPILATVTAGNEAVLSTPTLTSGRSHSSNLSLYFHLPFCSYKCPYCHFYVVPDKEILKHDLQVALFQELEIWKEAINSHRIVSIYFGGGTPLLFGPERIKELLDWIKPPSNIEITLEANPEHISSSLLREFKAAGVNRLSIGVQSFIDSELISLGRKHKAEIAEKAVLEAHKAGFENISIDLMYEVPNQTLDSWQTTLNKAVQLPITHLSLYNLTIEPFTPFAKKEKELRALMPSNEVGTEMYEMAISTLSAHGLIQYEISAFAHPNRHSVHNTGYWTGRPFLGFGPSAFSFYQNKRFRNQMSLQRYSSALKEGSSPIDFVEEISTEKRERELLVIGLRLCHGINLCEYTIDNETLTLITDLQNQGFLDKNDRRIQLTPRGRLFYDHVASTLI